MVEPKRLKSEEDRACEAVHRSVIRMLREGGDTRSDEEILRDADRRYRRNNYYTKEQAEKLIARIENGYGRGFVISENSLNGEVHLLSKEEQIQRIKDATREDDFFE